MTTTTVYFNKRHDEGLLRGMVTQNHVTFPTMEAAQVWIEKAQDNPALGLFRVFLGKYNRKHQL